MRRVAPAFSICAAPLGMADEDKREIWDGGFRAKQTGTAASHVIVSALSLDWSRCGACGMCGYVRLVKTTEEREDTPPKNKCNLLLEIQRTADQSGRS